MQDKRYRLSCNGRLTENRVAYWMASMLSDSESHFCCLKPFQLPYLGKRSMYYQRCLFTYCKQVFSNVTFHRATHFCSVLQPSSIRGLATPWTYFLHLSLSSVILIDSSTWNPVHVLMLSIQAVDGLPCLHAPVIVSCIISFSLVSSWYDHSMLASLLWQCLTVPSLLQLC